MVRRKTPALALKASRSGASANEESSADTVTLIDSSDVGEGLASSCGSVADLGRCWRTLVLKPTQLEDGARNASLPVERSVSEPERAEMKNIGRIDAPSTKSNARSSTNKSLRRILGAVIVAFCVLVTFRRRKV